MKKWLLLGIVGVLALGSLGVALTNTAFAQDDDPEAETSTCLGKRHGPGHQRVPLLGKGVILETAADLFGMDPEELQSQLLDGANLLDIAEEHGVSEEELSAAIEAARVEILREQINQAVSDETITQEHGDWLLEGLDKGFLNGFGHGGLRVFHGPGVDDFPFGPKPADAEGTDG
jgi:hypothetical protein